MNSLSPRLSRVTQAVAQSFTTSQSSQIMDQTRDCRASHSISPGLRRALMQCPLLPQIYRHQVRTQHTTPRTRQSMSCKLNPEIQKRPYGYSGLERESRRIRSSSEANLRVLCYGLASFSVVATLGRILGLISDDLDSEAPGREDIILPGFLGKSTVEAINAVAKNYGEEEEEEIRGTRRNRFAIYKKLKPWPKSPAKEGAIIPGDNQHWMPGLEALMFVYPGVF